MNELRSAFACAVILAGITCDSAMAQNAVFTGRGRYQQQVTKQCPGSAECVMNFKKVPAGKQVVTDTLSCEEITGFLPFFEIYDGAELLFRVGAPNQSQSRPLSLVLDPSQTVKVRANVAGSAPRTLSCLITGTIANKS